MDILPEAKNDLKGISIQKVTWVEHLTDTLFRFGVERPEGFKFRAGQFAMLGLLKEDGEPLLNDKGATLMRAYSIASSPNNPKELEFLSIKVPDGPLTEHLQKIHAETDGQPASQILLKNSVTGNLTIDELTPGKRLYLLGTGTGLAPFLSIIRDHRTFENFDEVIVGHGVRLVKELSYRELLTKDLREIFHEITLFENQFHMERDPNVEAISEEEVRGYYEEIFAGKVLDHYPTVSQENFEPRQGRLTHHINSGRLFSDRGLDQMNFNPETDRVMICGSAAMNKEMQEICLAHGLVQGSARERGTFVIERAFVGEGLSASPG